MYQEQGTVVSSSKFESFASSDLLDLRLPRAFKAWADFRVKYNNQIESIGLLPSAEVATLAGILSNEVIGAIGINPETEGRRRISTERVTQLTNAISGPGNKIIFMRHGEQSPPEWVSSISDPRLRKIRMMQDPFNRDDLLTNRSLADTFATSFILLYVQALTGKKVHVLSSENRRAKEPAEIISTIIQGSTFSTDEGLSCATYRDENDEPPLEIEDLLVDIPQGILPWDPKLVDKVCKNTRSGQKQSEVIKKTIGDLVETGVAAGGDSLFLVLTHTQQLAQVLEAEGRLQDQTIRFPELTMIVLNNPTNLLILRRGVLTEEAAEHQGKRTSMRRVLETLGNGYEWYHIRRKEYDNGQKIPFYVGTEPLNLSSKDTEELRRIGTDVVDFMHAADELYRTEGDVKNLLDRGKPKLFQQAKEAKYLFVRPDLLMTDKGFSICEIETSPFGLALAQLLNEGYASAGFNTFVDRNALGSFLRDNTPSYGSIIYTGKTSSYLGQLQFFAKELLSGSNRKWEAVPVDSMIGIEPDKDYGIYRAFYQHEYFEDLFLNRFIQDISKNDAVSVVPSFTPHMEEKALLALIWDRRWEPFFKDQLGSSVFAHLKEVIPPTWIVGEERFSTIGLPGGVGEIQELAAVSRSKRKFVLKKSGFGTGSSWAEGVYFLQDKSKEMAKSLLLEAQRDDSSLYVIQEFRTSQERSMSYEGDNEIGHMKARIRLTPYFSMGKDKEGELLAIKATGCEGTNYIHASTVSINTAVAVA